MRLLNRSLNGSPAKPVFLQATLASLFGVKCRQSGKRNKQPARVYSYWMSVEFRYYLSTTLLIIMTNAYI